MDFFDVVNKRVSVRKYASKPIERKDIERIVDAGRLAATARNVQPWRFIVTVDKKKIKELSQIVSPNGAFMVEAVAAIIILSADTKYYLEDCSAATQNILLAASSLGIGACWIAGDKKDYANKVASFAKACPGELLVSVISLGYPLEPAMPKPKKSLDELISWL